MKIQKLINPKRGVDLSIVIVNFNGERFLGKCIDSIRENLSRRKFEMFIVDNNSKDDSVELIKRNYPEVKLIENCSNFGFSYANNQAIVRSRGKYIMLLNPDTVITQGALDVMMDFMDKNPVVGVAGAKLLNLDGSIQYSFRRFPTIQYVFFGRQSIFRKLFPDNRISRAYMMMDENHSKNIEVDWVFGTGMMLRRKALEEVGIFDEDYFIFVEDTDLCYRMREENWKVSLVADAVIFHHFGVTRDRFWKITLLNHNRGMFKFFKKHYHLSLFTEMILSAGLTLRLFLLIIVKTAQGFFRSELC